MNGARVLTIVLVCLIPTVFIPSAPAQSTLENLAIRSFEIAVSITPVPLKVEFGGPAGVWAQTSPSAFSDVRLTSRGTMRGKTTAMVEVTAQSPVPTARFLLDSDLKLTSVSAPGHQAASGRQRDTLTLTFTPALPPGGRVPVTFDYEGQPLYIYDEFVMIREGTLYPVLVSPFGDFSANLARVTLSLTSPDGYNITGTGKLISKHRGTLKWDSEIPIPWVAVAGGRKHATRVKTAQGVTMEFYVPAGEGRNLDKLADFAGKSVDYYSRLLYPFPYSEFRVVSLLIVGGGIGYPALLLIDDRAFLNTLPGGRNRDSYLLLLIAHEVAHSYVPSQTVPRGVGFIWLSEGFAQYLSLMAIEALQGPEAFKRELQQQRDDYAPIAGTDIEPSISTITFANYRGPAGVVIYNKGALVLHMLRGVLGDETFKKGLATYFSSFRGQSARVSDFQQVMEQAAGQPLDWFFRQWIHAVVLPDYTITQATSAPAAEGGFRASATVRNLGTGEMPVEVGFVMEGDLQIQKVQVPSRGEASVSTITQKPVKQVEVDPRKWIVQKNYKNDVAAVK